MLEIKLAHVKWPIAALLGAMALACTDKSRNATDAAALDAAPVDRDAQLPANARIALTKPTGTTKADEAVVAAQNAVRGNMEKDDAWIALGKAWLETGLDVNADACASVVLGKDPDNAAAADLRGTVLLHRRDFAEARTLAERITAKHPNDAIAWGHLSDALVELGRYEEASDATNKMVELAPNASSYSRAARLQWLNGDVARAKDSIARAMDANADAAVFVQAGMISWHEGAYDDADARFDKALARTPDFAPALAGKGRVAMARSDYSRAADFFQRSYTAHPSIETAWLLGDARYAASDAKGSNEAYALVTKDRATDVLTYSLFLSTRSDRTKAERDEAVEIASQEHVKRLDVYTEDALAWALYRAGMIEPAKSSMARARRLHTPDARIMFHEGAIRIAGGDVKKGKELVAKALALNPAFDWRGAREARALIER